MNDSAQTKAKSIVGPLPWENTPPTAQTLPELLDQIAQRNPDAPALVVGDVRRSYKELSDRAQQFATALSELGVTANTHVSLIAPNTEEWLVAAFGAMRLGVSLHAFHTWVQAWDLDYLLGASQTEVLITVPSVRSKDILGELRKLLPEWWDSSEPTESRFPHLQTIIVIGDDVVETPIPEAALDFEKIIHDAGSEPPKVAATAEGDALVLYTSGTTEFPKAVPLSHRNMIENGFSIGERMGLGSNERVWLGSPLFWSFGIANAGMATMTHEGCLVLQERFTPAEAAQVMANEQCTAAYLLPSIAIGLSSEVPEQMRNVKTLRTGLTIGRAEEIEHAIKTLDIPYLCNIYGSTEVYGNCAVTPSTLPTEVRITTQGPPLHGVELRIVNLETGEVVDQGDTGEIQVRGRVTRGYIGNEKSTAEAIDPDGWFRTGDLGLIRDDGMLQFVSRHSDMIKTSGINVSPSEVEAFIAQLDGVAEVVVVGAPHPERDEVPIAFIVPAAGADVTEESIIKQCRSSISSFKVPWAVAIIPELPKTVTGKITRKSLIEPATTLVNERLATLQSATTGAQ